MKKILFLLLIPFAIYGQITVVGDTIDLKNTKGSNILLMQHYASGTNNGGGFFIRVDSAYIEDGTNAFDYPYDGSQWVRLNLVDQYVRPSTSNNSVGIWNTNAYTPISQDSLINLLLPSTKVGTDVFTTTAETDTVTISGALATDIYFVTGQFTSAIDQQDILHWEALAGKLVVHRMAAGESALKYSWLRIPSL